MDSPYNSWLMTRRQALKLGVAGGAGFFLATRFGELPRLFAQAIPGPTLDPTQIPQFATPLVIPPAMPRTSKLKVKGGKQIDYYEIATREFTQQILPATDQAGLPTGLPPTKVWSYCSLTAPLPLAQGGTLHYPALTIEAKANKPNRVKWVNQLVDANGNYLPHLLPVDQTLHWANPPGGAMHRDHMGMDGTPYTGPVPMVTHLHGAHVAEHSDGHPQAWFLPAANNIPAGYATKGTYYEFFDGTNPAGRPSPIANLWGPGSAVYDYPNDQSATTLWYHDHTLGMTRVNVYAGPAGFYILRGGPGDLVLNAATGTPAVLPGPAPAVGDRPGTAYFEIPIVIQDRSFKTDGSLFYPDNRAFFEGLDPNQLDIPFMPQGTSDIAPIWNPEFFGNVMVVNGYAWPYLNVEPRRYRLRLLNGCDSRFLLLQFADVTGAPAPGVDVWQIGAEQGYLAAPFHVTDPASVSITNNQLLIAPAERADIIVDFTGLPAGTTVRLMNLGPDEPFGGVGPDMPNADPATTGQVMEFRVGALVNVDTTTPPAQLLLPAPPVQAVPAVTRQLSLNELMSMLVRVPFDAPNDSFVLLAFDPVANALVEDGAGFFVPYDPALHPNFIGKLVGLTPAMELKLPAGITATEFGPMAAFLGTVDPAHPNADPLTGAVPMAFSAPVSETPKLGTSEVWEILNFTADAHPIHIHLVGFQVINREPIGNVDPALVRPPELWETGMKDTVVSYPGEITRVQATFDLLGLYMWHCHIVSHEDNEMMRPYQVVP